MTEPVPFGTLKIQFDARVLRPRPWTAAQSGWAAALLPSAPDGRVLELCAGAGQIGLLAVATSGRRLVCVDLDPVACAFARVNADAAGMGHRVDVREGSMGSVLGVEERFAAVIADPPWVPSADISRFPEDPVTAIDGGVSGVELAVDCVTQMHAHLLPGGFGLLQLGTSAQVRAIRLWLEEVKSDCRLTEVREYGERGVLTLLERSSQG